MTDALSNPAIIAVASLTPFAVGIYSSWTAAQRNLDITLAVVRYISPVNLVAATGVPLACLVAVTVLWTAIGRGVMLSNGLFWTVVCVGAISLPGIAVPAFAGLALCAVIAGAPQEVRPRARKIFASFSSRAALFLASIVPFVSATIIALSQQTLITSGKLERGSTAEVAGSIASYILLSLSIGSMLVYTKGNPGSVRGMPFIGRAFPLLFAATIPIAVFLGTATGIKWLPREAILLDSAPGSMSVVGHVLDVNDSTTVILNEFGMVEHYSNSQVVDRDLCPRSSAIDAGTSLVGVVSYVLDSYAESDLPEECNSWR